MTGAQLASSGMMALRLASVMALAFTAAACQFDSRSPSAADGIGDDGNDGDGGDGDDSQQDPPPGDPPPDETPRVEGVLHLPPEAWTAGTASLSLTGGVIDTDALALPAPVKGVVFDAWPQPSGPELAVLHVERLEVAAGAAVRVVGARALIVIASSDIVID